jgi:hypothetical protein
MAGGVSQLQPVPTPAQRLAARIVDVESRLTELERTRPAVSVSDADPTDPAVPGTMHLNKAQGRFWLYTGSAWVTADSQHVYGEALGTVGAGASGPTLTLDVSDYGVAALFAEAELQAPSGGSASLVVQASGGASFSTVLATTTSTSFERRGSSGGGTISGLGPDRGAIWGGGGWVAFTAAAGPLTLTLSVGGSAGATARNRRLYGMVL